MEHPGTFGQLLSEALARGAAEAFAQLARRPVTSLAQASAVCDAAPRLAAIAKSLALPHSGLHYLLGFFQAAETAEAFNALRGRGLPFLYREFDARLDDPQQDAADLLFMLKIFGLYRTLEGVDRIVRAARKPLQPTNDLWPVVLGTFDAQHPFCTQLVDMLGNPLPPGAIGGAYLRLCNDMAMSNAEFRHPFDTPAGIALLQAWLAQTKLGSAAVARVVMEALPGIDEASRLPLIHLAMGHADPAVQMLGAHAAAAGGMEAGVEFLAQCCLNPNRSKPAMGLLKELGREEAIPARATEADFGAMVQLCEWLAHPRQFGKAPSEVELYDTRTLLWPPTNDRRRVWLFRYRVAGRVGEREEISGIGMVGSVTGSLFEHTTAAMPAEDVYAIHSAWELQQQRNPRPPA